MRYIYHPDALTEYADVALYYEEGYVLMVAVMHLSLEPGYWRHRISQRPDAG